MLNYLQVTCFFLNSYYRHIILLIFSQVLIILSVITLQLNTSIKPDLICTL